MPLLKTMAVAGAWCSAAILLYFQSLRGEFVFDDHTIYLTDNQLLHRPWDLWKFWFSTQPVDYLPIAYTFFWIEYRLWGLEPLGYHLASAVLHGLASMALSHSARIGRWLEPSAANFAGVLFLVHPVCVEAVAWSSQQKTLLAALFAFLAIGNYQRQSRDDDRTNWSAWLFFVISLLAKPAAIGLPVFLLAWEILFQRATVRAACRRLAPWFAASLLLGVVGLWFQQVRSVGEAPIRSDDFLQRVLISSTAVWFYIGKAIWPTGLTFVYPRWALSAANWVHWLPFLTLAHTTLGLLVCTRKNSAVGRAALLAASWYGVMLFPSIGLLDVGYFRYSFVADHYQYLALPGLIVAGTALWRQLPAPAVVNRVLGGLLVVLLGWSTIRLNREYRTAMELWESTLKKNPSAALAHASLGRIRWEQNDPQRAFRHFEEAYRLQPDSEEFQGDLAFMHVAKGEWSAAEAIYRTILKNRPGNTDAMRRLGETVLEQGRSAEAVELIERAFQRNLETPTAGKYAAADIQLLGRLYSAQGRRLEARQSVDQGLQTFPLEASIHESLGILLLGENRAAAEAAFSQALKLDPNRTPATLELARLLDARGDSRSAAELLERAWGRSAEAGLANIFLLACSPDDSVRNPRLALERLQKANPSGVFEAAVYDSLAVASAAVGDFENARSACQAALKACDRSARPNDPVVTAAKRRLEARLKSYQAERPFRGRLVEAVGLLPAGRP